MLQKTSSLRSLQKSSEEYIAERYRIETQIGRGGKAKVFQVFDVVANRRVALKRLILLGDLNQQDESITDFEHEYHTLSHLVHPRLIEVYEYGIDHRGPYYTMELLSGGDLYAHSPMDWQKVCSILSDICCALSLIHSCRLIHRDITPRNIRCNEHGHAKLIDFGAMVPIGPCKHFISTPPFTPPEMVNYQSLDVRVDLFSLGTTAYYLLTGRHAYPARGFKQLRDVWRSQPHPPSKFIPDIPPCLDSLVQSLIALNPMARPSNTTQVLESLKRIVNVKIDEELVYPQTCINKPTLVGREDHLLRVRRLMIRALRGKGGSLMVKGSSGVGLSRFLDACVFEAKIVGALVLRADAVDARQGDYGVVRTLLSQLMSTVPQLAKSTLQPYLPELKLVFPELQEQEISSDILPNSNRSLTMVDQKSRLELDSKSKESSEIATMSCPPSILKAKQRDAFLDSSHIRSQLQTALVDWLQDISSKQFILLAVDDLNSVDEPSAAFLAVLGFNTRKKRLVVVTTSVSDAEATSPSAIKFIEDAGSRIKLRHVNLHDTTKLLCSLFGEVTHLVPFAHRVHELSEGKPHLCMNILQHFVDREVIRFEQGAWLLPKEIHSSDIPSTNEQIFLNRFYQLSPDAKELAFGLALGSDDMLRLGDYIALSEHQQPARLYCALDELVSAQVLTTNGKSYDFTQKSWISVLLSQLDDQKRQVLHLRLARLLEQQSRHGSRVAIHLLQAGKYGRAVELLVDFSEKTLRKYPHQFQEVTEVIYCQKELAHALQLCLAYCEKKAKSRRNQIILHKMLLFMASYVESIDFVYHIKRILTQLAYDCGLDIWQQKDPEEVPIAHHRRVLVLAKKRYHRSPEAERVHSPMEALREMPKYLIHAAVFGTTSLDGELLESLPNMEPFYSIGPSFRLVDSAVKASIEFMRGRFEQSLDGFQKILERIEQPDRAGLNQTYYYYARFSIIEAITSIEAMMCNPLSLERVKELDKEPFYLVKAWKIRMLYHYHQGNIRQAENCRKQAELHQIEHSAKKFHPGTSLWSELLCCTLADDPVGVKYALDCISTMANRYSGWVPVFYTAQGEYDRIRGDYKSASEFFQMALNEIIPSCHMVWPVAVSSQICSLINDDRAQEARELGIRQLKMTEKADLGCMCHLISAALAWAEAKLGDIPCAIERCERAIEDFEKRGITGIYLGYLFELRSRLSILDNNSESFIVYSELCARQYKLAENPAFLARYERLADEARQYGIGISSFLCSTSDSYITGTLTEHATTRTMLTDCQGSQERAQRSLSMLISESGAVGGYLFTMQSEGPTLVAMIGEQTLPSGIEDVVQSTLAAELSAEDMELGVSAERGDSQVSESVWISTDGDRYFILTLGHQRRDGFVITAVALLRMKGDKKLVIPWDVASELSYAFLEMGDVIKIYAG